MTDVEFSRRPNYIRVRYEDFVKHPNDTMTRVLNFLGEHPGNLNAVFLSENIIHMKKPQHIFAGNPEKLAFGDTVRVAYRGFMLGRYEEFGVRMITWALAKRYGYY